MLPNEVIGTIRHNDTVSHFRISKDGFQQWGAPDRQLGERVEYVEGMEEVLNREGFFEEPEEPGEPDPTRQYGYEPPDDDAEYIDDDEMPTVREEDQAEYLKSIGAL